MKRTLTLMMLAAAMSLSACGGGGGGGSSDGSSDPVVTPAPVTTGTTFDAAVEAEVAAKTQEVCTEDGGLVSVTRERDQYVTVLALCVNGYVHYLDYSYNGQLVLHRYGKKDSPEWKYRPIVPIRAELPPRT